LQQQNLMDLLPEKTNKKLHRRDFFKKSGIAVASATVLAGSLSAYSSYAQNKSGKFEIHSELLKKKGFNPMPTWFPVPDFENKKDDELILSSFKVNLHTHSRTANCKWLSEIYHDNSALINPITAEKRGIETGDTIIVKSAVGKVMIKARVSEGIVPDLIAISFHLGHWQYGWFASGEGSPFGTYNDNDLDLKWWSEHGVNPNWLIRNRPDRIAGQWLMNDEIVTVTKV